MPLNVPGILAPLQFIINPRIIVPGLAVKDIRHLNFKALKRAGYRGVVFDKDNCLTLPEKDSLVPELKETWNECRDIFGKENVLLVSNSAGSHRDAGGIQAESVRHHLGVSVLFHTSMKPGYSCVNQIRSYFRSIHQPVMDDELVIIGDRLFTDMVLASRIRERSWRERFGLASASTAAAAAVAPSPVKTVPPLDSNSPSGTDESHPMPMMLPTRTTLGIWTTGVWKTEATLMRFCERKLLEGVKKWIIAPAKARAKAKTLTQAKKGPDGAKEKSEETVYDAEEEDEEEVLKRAFVRQVPSSPSSPPKNSFLQTVVGFVQGLQFRKSS